jgi:hypothetical protein
MNAVGATSKSAMATRQPEAGMDFNTGAIWEFNSLFRNPLPIFKVKGKSLTAPTPPPSTISLPFIYSSTNPTCTLVTLAGLVSIIDYRTLNFKE